MIVKEILNYLHWVVFSFHSNLDAVKQVYISRDKEERTHPIIVVTVHIQIVVTRLCVHVCVCVYVCVCGGGGGRGCGCGGGGGGCI